MLTGIVQGWCPKFVFLSISFRRWQSDAAVIRCTARPDNLDVNATRRTQTFSDGLVQVFDRKKLWHDYGIDNNIIVRPYLRVSHRPFLTNDYQPFTSDFPRGDIYEMISPDILHQLIKGTFKDHLVAWICEYILLRYGERQSSIILDDIDRRYVHTMSLYMTDC